jgi:group I intron endonuclease
MSSNSEQVFKGVVYKTTNLINGKFYVGRDSRNCSTYKGSGKLLWAAIRKYGWHNFEKTILEHCSSKEHLDEREKFWIKELDATNKDIAYNISPGGIWGGRVGYKLSEETKNKISDKLKLYDCTEEHRQSLSNSAKRTKAHERLVNANIGRAYSVEHRHKLSVAAKNRIVTDETKAILSNALTGRTLSDTHKESISKGLAGKTKGKIITAEHRRQISEKLKGRVIDKEVRQRMGASRLGKSRGPYKKKSQQTQQV